VYPFAGACLLLALRFADGLGFVPGLLTASPLAAAGVALAWKQRRMRPVTAIAVLALPLVWFFQYSGGANPQWGGRYVLLSGALLAVLGIVGLATAPRPARVALVALAIVTTSAGVAWLSARSHTLADAMETISRTRGAVVSTELHLLREGGAFYDVERPWLTATSDREIERAAEIVARTGHDRLTLVGAARGPASVGGFERTGARRLELLPGFEVVLSTYRPV
jgi:hypothetical protein